MSNSPNSVSLRGSYNRSKTWVLSGFALRAPALHASASESSSTAFGSGIMQIAAIVEQRAWSEPGARHLEVHSFLRKLAGMLGA